MSKLVFHRRIIFLFAFLLAFIISAPVYAEETDITTAAADSSQTGFWSNKTLGIDAGTVFTGDYDTGFGVGARFNQTFYHPFVSRPFLRSTPSIQFWGASNDSSDVSVIGIFECLTHRAPFHRRLTGFAGLTFGYYYIYKKINRFGNGTVNTIENKNNSFELFITLGVEYELPKNRFLFLQLKYGKTKVSREVHTLLGFNFRPGRISSRKDAKPQRNL